jgi:hypothetical protein
MSLAQRLAEHVAAAFTGLWVQSCEHEDALTEIARLCRDRKWSSAVWDVDRGLRIAGTGNGNGATTAAAAAAASAATDPLAAIRAINTLAPAKNQPDGSALLVLPNFHRFLQSAEIVQALAHQIHTGKQNRTFIVILSPVVQVPVELEKHFVVIDHELPDRGQLQKIAEGVATESGELPKGQDLQRLLDAASGLTRYEAEGAFSLSLVREAKVTAQTVWELKGQALKKSGLLTLHRGTETFADLGGLDALKGFCTRALNPGRKTAARPRGVLLLSPPGCGKSQFCKALGNETGRPTVILDIGTLMGSLVGQTEQNVRQALRIADAMAPCILMIEELEKALGGVVGGGGGGGGDSGVSARLFGTFLTWLSDHTSDVFVVCTSNDISKLPPEFSRAERFDGVFFLDTPGTAEKERIWPIHLARYGMGDVARDRRPADPEWTGAEIQSCCRLAALLDVPLKDAARNVVPVAVTAAESVAKLRAWASGRCLDAGRPGIYSRGAPEPDLPSARRVTRPSNN